MRAPAAIAVVLIGLVSLGCSDESAGAAAGTTGTPTDCKPGEYQRDDGSCMPAGIPSDMPCPPGEWLRETDGNCIPAGVPPDGCGVGFVHDGDRGCDAILPADPCAPGLMAVPGDTECHEVAPCGSGAWGEIPVEPDTEYVDQTYANADSDGSAQKPWKTIADAVAVAPDGAIIAIAAGAYGEDVVVQGKPVRLWGRCPAMVEIVGTGVELAALQILADASGAEAHRLAIRGAAFGVGITGSRGVIVEEAWVHDNAATGIVVENAFGPTSVVVRGSLFESNHETGVLVGGGDVLVEASAIRGTLPTAQGLGGRGVGIQRGAEELPSTVTVRASSIEQNREVGVLVSGSDAIVESSVVRGTLPSREAGFGYGILARADPSSGAPSSVTVLASVVEDNHEAGLAIVGSDAVVETTIVRRTLPNVRDHFGRGVEVVRDPASGAPSTLTLHASLVQANHEAGVFVAGSDAVVDATAVRDTHANRVAHSGRGVHVQSDAVTAAPSTLTLRASLLERNRVAGLLVISSTASVDACLVRESIPGEITGSLGDGVVAWSANGPCSVTIERTRVHQSSRAAVSSFGAYVSFAQSELSCQTIDVFGAPYEGFPHTLDDLGGNLCGCPDATATCVAMGEGLEQPPPIGGLE